MRSSIFILQIQPDTASHTIQTINTYFVIFCGWHVPNFRPPCHGIVASSSDIPLGSKQTWISVENFHTQTVFWIAYPGLICHQSCPVHHFLPLIVLISLSVVKAKGQIASVYVEELCGCDYHCTKFQFDSHQTSQYESAHNSQNIVFHNALYKAMISKRKWQKEIQRASESFIILLQLYGSKNVG